MREEERRKTLGKADYREKNMCIFCKSWLGAPADTNFATGKSKFSNAKGLCRNDGKCTLQTNYAGIMKRTFCIYKADWPFDRK